MVKCTLRRCAAGRRCRHARRPAVRGGLGSVSPLPGLRSMDIRCRLCGARRQAARHPAGTHRTWLVPWAGCSRAERAVDKCAGDGIPCRFCQAVPWGEEGASAGW